MRLPSVIRWILVIPSAIVAWYFAFLVGATLFVSLVGPCFDTDAPQPQFCEATWFEPMRRGLFFFGVGLSAILVVVASAIMAPSHRSAVAWIAAGAGTVMASVMGFRAEAIAEAVVAIACGTLAAFFLPRFLSRSRGKKVAHTNVVPTQNKI
jgi:hypothetical protein